MICLDRLVKRKMTNETALLGSSFIQDVKRLLRTHVKYNISTESNCNSFKVLASFKREDIDIIGQSIDTGGWGGRSR